MWFTSQPKLSSLSIKLTVVIVMFCAVGVGIAAGVPVLTTRGVASSASVSKTEALPGMERISIDSGEDDEYNDDLHRFTDTRYT